MASHKRNWGICDECGFRYHYRLLKRNSYGMMICPDDWEGNYDLKNHPQNKAPDVQDQEYVSDPRPEVNQDRNKLWNKTTSTWGTTTQDWNAI